MTEATQRIAAALVAALIAGTSLTAVVTVPPADDGQPVATIAAPEVA
ncbi:hypothetical protein [Alteriqipengyuania lutimaris]|nr:hypothetical protein [Alteriqipengyuania lutimaris]MBB3034638.1 hypothetical protein [Alteriqipengyuania lutimaris]